MSNFLVVCVVSGILVGLVGLYFMRELAYAQRRSERVRKAKSESITEAEKKDETKSLEKRIMANYSEKKDKRVRDANGRFVKKNSR